MSDLVVTMENVKEGLGTLCDQIEGAARMLNDNSPHREFMDYIRSCLTGMHANIAWELKKNKEKKLDLDLSPPHCS